MLQRCFLLGCAIFLAGSVNAQQVIILQDSTKAITLGPQLQLLRDATHKLTLQEVSSPAHATQFEPSRAEVPSFGFGHVDYWLRFRLVNNSSEPFTYLEVSNLFIKHLQLFLLGDGGSVFSYPEAGSIHPFSARPLAYRTFVFPIRLAPGQACMVYLHTYDAVPNQFPLTLWQPKAFTEASHRSDYLLGLYFGILSIMILYNLFVYTSLRDRSYLIYVLYITCFALAQLCSTGYAMEYLWGDYPNLNLYAVRIFQMASLLWAVLFARTFLNTRINTPRWHYFSYLCLCLLGVYGLLLAVEFALFLAGSPLEERINDVVLQLPLYIISAAVLFVVVAGLLTVRSYRPARFYLTAWTLFIFGTVVYTLRSAGLLPSNFFTQYFFYGTSALEVALLSLALADKINIIKEERAYAQAEAIDALQANERLIAEQNRFLEIKVQERTQEVVAQKELIEEKNKDIIESITYARRIQESILPDREAILQALPNSFILYKPRDIVSGDFYWFYERDGKSLLAAVDCTGHGVPGAFMSVMGNTLLNQVVNDLRELSPGPILNELNQRVTETLKQNAMGTAESKDGMEVALCMFDMQANEIIFAGANRPLYLWHEGELKELRGDKVPIGGGQLETVAFSEAVVYPTAGDVIYISSDGYVDQFGGDNRRKFMSRRFKELLAELHDAPLEAQALALDKVITEWMGPTPQTDDILVMGVKF